MGCEVVGYCGSFDGDIERFRGLLGNAGGTA